MFPEVNFETVATPDVNNEEKCSDLSLGLPCICRIKNLYQNLYESPVNPIISHPQTNAMEFKD